MGTVMARKVEDDRVEAVWGRAERRAAADKREAEAIGKVRAPGRKALKRLSKYERNKPTAENAARGEFEVMPAEKFDTARKGEKVLVNLAARGRGAATMYARGQLKLREYQAAERICLLAETAGASQLSGVPLSERVAGGRIDIEGNRLRAAGEAFGKYRDALERLSSTGRSLVENVVVLGRPMEEAVQMRSISRRVGDQVSLKKRVEKASVLLAEALDHLADVFGMPAA